jgi:hypothetical protein
VRLAFAIPAGLDPDSIQYLELNWSVDSGDARISKTTPFYRGGAAVARSVTFVPDPFWWYWPHAYFHHFGGHHWR